MPTATLLLYDRLDLLIHALEERVKISSLFIKPPSLSVETVPLEPHLTLITS